MVATYFYETPVVANLKKNPQNNIIMLYLKL